MLESVSVIVDRVRVPTSPLPSPSKGKGDSVELSAKRIAKKKSKKKGGFNSFERGLLKNKKPGIDIVDARLVEVPPP